MIDIVEIPTSAPSPHTRRVPYIPDPEDFAYVDQLFNYDLCRFETHRLVKVVLEYAWIAAALRGHICMSGVIHFPIVLIHSFYNAEYERNMAVLYISTTGPYSEHIPPYTMGATVPRHRMECIITGSAADERFQPRIDTDQGNAGYIPPTFEQLNERMEEEIRLVLR